MSDKTRPLLDTYVRSVDGGLRLGAVGRLSLAKVGDGRILTFSIRRWSAASFGNRALVHKNVDERSGIGAGDLDGRFRERWPVGTDPRRTYVTFNAAPQSRRPACQCDPPDSFCTYRPVRAWPAGHSGLRLCLGPRQERCDEVHRQRKYDGRILVCADHRQRLQVPQLNCLRLLRQYLGGLEQFFRSL